MNKVSYTIGGGSNRRRDRRMASPELTVEIHEACYTILDWGLGGFRIGDYDGGLAVGDRFAARMIGRLGSRGADARVFARVVRKNRTSGEMAAAFYEFEDGAFETLERLATRRLARQHR